MGLGSLRMGESFLWLILLLWKYITGNVQQPRNAERRIAEPRKLGLNQVYPDRSGNATRTEIDIVAIHGLDTHSPKTWVAWKRDGDPESGEVHWLRDSNMLPSKIPAARIFTYDWNANFDQDASAQGLLGHADGLLEKLHICRSNDRSFDRPIIFVASCFGGLLLCRALHRASEAHNKYHHILKSTVAVAFLGTPFQGSHQGFFTATQLRLNVAISEGDETADELIKYLSNNDSERRQLDDVIQQFCEMVNSNKFKFPIICFYETQRTDFTKVIKKLSLEYRKGLGEHDTGVLVPEYSACLQGQARSALNVRHGMLNKFAGPEDEAFKTVSHYLNEFVEEALQKSPDAWIRNNHYTAERLKIERLSGDQLSIDHCYINLAIIEQSGRDAPQSKKESEVGDTPQLSPFSLSARLKVESLGNDIQIELAKIFDLRKGSDGHTTQPRRILIRGRAGVGKTTLCKKMVHDFLRGTWNNLFDRVLWVPLRRLKALGLQEFNLEELFYHEYFHDSSKGRRFATELWRTVEDGNGETLFILDGWDEVAESLHSSDNLPRFLKTLLNQQNVIITSRPSGTLPPDLHALHLELETVGFYKDQVKEYIEEVFRDDRQKADEIQSFLQQHLFIQSLMRIPVQLDALCYTWDEDSISGRIPETMTAVYQAIEQRLWKKDVVRLGKKREGYVREARLSEIKRDVKAETKLLGWLAFTGLHGDVIEFQSSHLDAISERFEPPEAAFPLNSMLKSVSFLRTSDPLAKDRHQSYHFLHLTFQEYFAAQYFAQRWNDREKLMYLVFDSKKPKMVESEPIIFLQNHKYNARYDIFWRFVAGLLHANHNEKQLYYFFRTIEDQPRDLLGPVHQRLIMHCLSEVVPPQETLELKQLREHLEGQLKQWLVFECKFHGNSRLAAEMEFPAIILDAVLREESEDAKVKVLNSLGAKSRLPQTTVNHIASLLSGNGSKELKRAVLQVLGSQAGLPEEILQAIAALLRDPERDIRVSAAEALENQAGLPEEILQAIAPLLRDPDWHIRSTAAEALENQEGLPEEILQAIAPLLRDPEGDIRASAVEALENQAGLPEEILQAIAALLRDPEWHIRYSAVAALGNQAGLPEEILQAIAALLRDPEWHVRSTAAKALGNQARLPEEIFQAIAALLRDPETHIRSTAAKVLGNQAGLPEEILQAIAPLLRDPEWHIRASAVKALGNQAGLPEEIFQAIAALLQDPEGDIWRLAVRTLEGLPDEIFCSFLLKMDGQSFKRLYGSWLETSFLEHLTWYGEGLNASINMPERSRSVPFEELQSLVREVQRSLGVPHLEILQ